MDAAAVRRSFSCESMGEHGKPPGNRAFASPPVAFLATTPAPQRMLSKKITLFKKKKLWQKPPRKASS
jgi:hypothetical protein